MSKEFHKRLAEIQQQLKAPKNQFNKFGGYNYRNQEDILEAVKPLLGDLTLTVNDEIVHFATYEGEGRFYVKATVTISDGEHSISNSAYAREDSNKKGMDTSQLTGSTSSYARKYALNGLFLIDDTRDADAVNTHGKKEVSKPVAKEKVVQAKPSTSSFRRKKKEEPQGDFDDI
jgi:hypothetical protein